MHIFLSIALILGAVIILVAGFIRVLHDLLERGPYEAPLLNDDELAWPRPSQEKVPPALNLDLPRNFHHVFGREVESVDDLD
jgi:hypothetical protein